MKIIVDESLGISKEYLEELDVSIRKTRLKKNESLEKAIIKEQSRFISRKLDLLKGSINPEMEEIHSYLEKYGDILYIYDPFVTDGGVLKRISNWDFPTRKLYLIDGSSNRAFTIFLLQQLQLNSFEEVYQMSSSYDHLQFTITNDIKYKMPSHYLKLKEKKQARYFLLKGPLHQKVSSGVKAQLLESLLEHIPNGKIFITARTQLPPTNRAVNFFMLEEMSLPISSDKIDIFISS